LTEPFQFKQQQQQQQQQQQRQQQQSIMMLSLRLVGLVALLLMIGSTVECRVCHQQAPNRSR